MINRPHRPDPAVHPLVAIAAGLALLSGIAGCGNSSSSGSPTEAISNELRASGFADYLDVQSPSRETQTGAWKNVFFDPASEQAICLNGSEYEVSVHRGTSKDVMLYLQGGGACWDYLTCHVVKTATTNANGAVETGIIDLSDPRNPFRDFNIVYGAYCDGSVFTGDATVDYNGIRTFHHGLWNLSVAGDAVRRQCPEAARIVVAGSSAGGYGT